MSTTLERVVHDIKEGAAGRVAMAKCCEPCFDPRSGDRAPLSMDCPHCHRPLRIATEHIRLTVACPHCGATFAPCSWRNRWVAGVLGVLLGPLGVHRFYLGYVGVGVLQIVLTFATFGIAGLWGFIEGILWLVSGDVRDAQGRPLRE